MEFFDKKQDVIDIKITRYGRQLLSRGQFKPAYYTFSDDEVIYDQRWISGTLNKEEQSAVEERIQEETVRVETLISKVGADITVFNANNGTQLQNIIDLYNINTDMIQILALQADETGELRGGPEEEEFQEILDSLTLDVDFADAEKLIRHTLGTKRYFTSFAPAWNVLFYHGEIANSSPTYFKKDLNKKVPQVNTTLTDKFYRLLEGQDAFTVYPAFNNVIDSYNRYGNLGAVTQASLLGGVSTDYLNTYYQSFPMENGSVFVEKDFLLLSFEEANVDFTKENFSLEVFEIIEPFAVNTPASASTEQLNRLMFSELVGDPTDTSNMVENYFDIELDTEINHILACTLTDEKELKTKNIYNAKVFDCKPLAADTEPTSADIYDMDQVDVEEVC